MIHLGPLPAGCLDQDAGGPLIYRPACGDGMIQVITPAAGDHVIALAPWNHISSAALHSCWRRGIDVCLVRGALITPLRSVTGPDPARLHLRRVQHRRHASDSWRIELARSLVDSKILAQRQILAQYRQRHGIVDLDRLIVGIAADHAGLARHRTVDAIRGVEGHCAKLAWEAIPHLTGTAGFRRLPRSGNDPLNLLFDCVYSWLTQLVALHVLECGADLGLGCLHSDDGNRPTLALDLIEPLRPIIADRFVLAAWRGAETREGWFRAARDRPGVDFTPVGRAAVTKRWNTWIFGGAHRIGHYGRVVATVRRWQYAVLNGGHWPDWRQLHDQVSQPSGTTVASKKAGCSR